MLTFLQFCSGTRTYRRQSGHYLLPWGTSELLTGYWPIIALVLIPSISAAPLFKERLKWSVGISMVGLIGNEFITIFTPGKGVFDWNDALATLIGGGVFLMIHRYIGGSIAAG